MRTAVIVCLAFIVLIAGCAEKRADKPIELTSTVALACEETTECVLVRDKGCCGCQIAINADAVDDWLDQEQPSCSGVVCEPCAPARRPACVAGKCTIS